MPFLSSLVKIGVRAEGTPGTAVVPSAGFHNVLCEGIKYDYPMEFTDRKYATGNTSPFTSIPGKQPFSCGFKTPLQGSGTAGVEPNSALFLRLCGLVGTNVAATSDTFAPHTDGLLSTGTIYVTEMLEGASPTSIRMGGKGMMGTGKVSIEGVGKPAYLECDMKGAAIDVADVAYGSIIVPGSFNTTVPPVMMSATVTAYTEVLELDKFNLDFGNTLQEQVDASDATGILLYSITDRNAMMSVDPYLRTIASRANYGRMKAGTAGAFSMVLGATAGNIITIAAPEVQIIKGYSRGDRNGKAINALELKLTRSSGNDDFTIKFT